MARILIIDDDQSFRDALAETLGDLGHQALVAATGSEGLALIRRGDIDIVLLDLRLQDMTGLDVLRGARLSDVCPPVVMLTAYAGADNTIEAMKLGAFDHLAKPVGRAQLERVLAEALRSFPPADNMAPPEEDAFVAQSDAMREVLKQIGRTAATEATVLISGETGTGKEIVARYLHRHSPRASRPFIAVNCAAIPADLLESELFGHVKGAFTGASSTRVGVFGQADGGSLLLDEIGDMSPDLQAKLLRVIESREIVPVGSAQPVRVNVRIIAATHRDLASRVAEGTFREDLFYRLDVIRIHLPPLRDRREDIVPLAEHFLALASTPAKALSADARRRLENHPWPGNIRELRNVIERASILSRHPAIQAEDLGLAGNDAAPASLSPNQTLPAALAQLEETMIRQALKASGGNRAEAARRLGIRRQLLHARLGHYGIEA